MSAAGRCTTLVTALLLVTSPGSAQSPATLLTELGDQYVCQHTTDSLSKTSLLRFYTQRTGEARQIQGLFDSDGSARIITVVLDVPGRDSIDTYALVARFRPDTEGIFGVINDSTSNLSGTPSLRSKHGVSLPPGARPMSNEEVDAVLRFGAYLWLKRCLVTKSQ